ncbi:MAG: pyruvate formate lyase family protein, partial [Mogibacterium sp.]|nr:pyruvate formate lyase family protein [Mogibacterium sp.]
MAITERVEKIRQNYVDTKPHISYERAWIYTKSFQKTEGKPNILRVAQAFNDTCNELSVNIWEGELVVGTSGEYRKCAILTPEFGWLWIDEEIETFPERGQDPYDVTEEQIEFIRKNIFPYWKGRSIEEAFLARTSEATKKIGVDTGFLDTDSKWRNGIGEISADYIDVLLPKGYGGLKAEALAYMEELDEAIPAEKEKIDFYKSMVLIADGMITLGRRYSDKASEMAAEEKDPARRAELEEIADICSRIPEQPPKTFREAVQFVWFVQLGGIIAENPLAWNPGRFDQYMYPYYKADLDAGLIDYDTALELVECLWLKYSEWAWT